MAWPRSTFWTAAAAAALLGCYQGTGPGPGHPSTATYLVVRATPKAGAPVPIAGINLSLVVPPGFDMGWIGGPGPGAEGPAPAARAPGDPLELPAARLEVRSRTGASALALGSYLPGSRILELALVQAARDPWSGDCLAVRLTPLPGQPANTAALREANPVLPACRVTGVDLVRHEAVDLTAQTEITLRIVPGRPWGLPPQPVD